MRAMLATDKARRVEAVSLMLRPYACLTAGCRAKSAEAAFSRLERYLDELSNLDIVYHDNGLARRSNDQVLLFCTCI